MAESGIMVSCPVETAAPEEALLLPLAAMAFWAALRCESSMPLALLAEFSALPEAEAAVTVPDGACVVAVPVAAPADVLIQIWFRKLGDVVYFGATSMTT